MSRPPSGRLKELKSQSPVPKHKLNPHKVIPDIPNKTGSAYAGSSVGGSSKGGSRLTSQILNGDPEASMHAGKKKAVRLFVSSTFTDTKVERNYLMREVYPGIRQLCQNNGVEFSIVDLRWGIRDTATNDHMTTEICLSEIEKCVTSSLPGAPCFMYLAFNRYGSPPLPRLVPGDEMEAILAMVTEEAVLKDIRKWYRKDENACPEVYTLQPISTYLPEFLNTQDMARRKELRNEWFALSDGMMSALRDAALGCNQLSESQRRKWLISTTHEEVLNCLLRSDLDKDTGLCYIRNIRQFDKLDTVGESHGNLVWRFIDLDPSGAAVDGAVRRTLEELKASVQGTGTTTRRFECDWDPAGIDEVKHADHIHQLAKAVRADLTERISQAINKFPRLDACTGEVASHVVFCEKKSSTFHGREDLVNNALKYFDQTPETHPLVKKRGTKPKPGEVEEVWKRQLYVVHGISGSGKTSLVAKLVTKTQDRFRELGKKGVFVTRFCGTTPMSSSSRELLASMSEQVTRAYSSNPEAEVLDLPRDYQALIEYFHSSLLQATEERPLVVCIDSLDQLSDADNGRRKLTWLPAKFPEHVYVIVSTLPDIGGCFDALKTLGILEYNLTEVPGLSPNDSEVIVQGWLKVINRKLTEGQFNYIQKVALDDSNEKPTTLRLRLLFDIAVKWTSYQDIPELPSTVKGLINMIFDNLEKTHGNSVVSIFCGLTGVSKLGLSENDLIDIMSSDDEVLNSVLQYHKPPIPRIPYHVFARLRHDLGDYIIERGAHGKSVLYWYHRQFWETSSERYLPQDKQSLPRYAGLIARYYSEEAHKEHPDRGLSSQPLYWTTESDECIFNTTKLSELPDAIKRAPAEFKHLYQDSLANPVFIAAKCSADLGRELLTEYLSAESEIKQDKGKLRSLLNSYNQFMTQNIHVLEKEPHLFLQQLENMSSPPENLKEILSGFSLGKILPWKQNTNMGAPFSLINRPTGEAPCFMTSPGQEVEGDIFGLDVLGLDDEDSYVVIGSSKANEDPKERSKKPYLGQIDIYHGATLQCFLSFICDTSVNSLKTYRRDKDSFWIVYNSLERKLRTLLVTLGDIPKATQVVTLDLETEILHAKVFRHSTVLRPPNGRTRFAVSRDGRVAGSAFEQVATRCNFYQCTKPCTKTTIKRRLQAKFFSSVLKIWDLKEAQSAWENDPSCVPSPMLEVEPVLANLVPPDSVETEKNSHPEGYYVTSLEFSPDDRFLVMVLLTEDDGETFSPFLSISDSRTMETLWSINNVIGVNHLSNLENDLTYWLSCLGGENDQWFITFASVRAITCVAVNSKNPKNIQAKRAWGNWKDMNISGGSFCRISSAETGKSKKVFVTHPRNKMEMIFEPELDLGDVNNWSTDERNSELTEFCRKKVFNPYHITVPKSLRPWGDRLPLSDLGSEIQRMYVDNNNAGVAVTVSKSGEIKVTDLSRYLTYKPPDKHEDGVLCCATSPDHKYVFTGTKRGGFGVWDPTTGKSIIIHEKPMPSHTPCSSILVSSNQEYVIAMQSNQIHFFKLKNVVDCTLKRLYGVHDMLIYTSRFQGDSSPTYKDIDDMDVSPDSKLVCAPHPKANKQDVVVGKIVPPVPGNNDKPPACLVKVYTRPEGTSVSFHGNYIPRFSPDGKYLAAFGSIHTHQKHKLSDEQWPPQIKLFEMVQWDEWKEVSEYNLVPQNKNYPGLKPNPDPGCSSITFLPDNKHLVSGTHHGAVKLHGVPDLKVITTIKPHTDCINSMRTVATRGAMDESATIRMFVVTCSRDHWVKVIQVGPGSLRVVAQYCNAVEPMCVTGHVDADDMMYIHVGDTGGLLSVIRVDLNNLDQK